ncbi:hypothetical protein RKLH11_2039 [Rhodobacteraceae bacterium KLH11]|nr:hypothetical protein RKLH11_2039 [Rhodobacteraceae bacterium KLH11]
MPPSPNCADYWINPVNTATVCILTVCHSGFANRALRNRVFGIVDPRGIDLCQHAATGGFHQRQTKTI